MELNEALNLIDADSLAAKVAGWLIELWVELDGSPPLVLTHEEGSRDYSGWVVPDYDSEFRPANVRECLMAYSGESEATFMSGMGLRWLTWEHKYQVFVEETFRDSLSEVGYEYDEPIRCLLDVNDWLDMYPQSTYTTITDILEMWAECKYPEFSLEPGAGYLIFADYIAEQDEANEEIATAYRQYADWKAAVR